jgi:4-carboxymuconolactone decarboxylase
VVLTTNQTLPQLKAHVHAALNVGLTPVEIKEAVYQCAPYLGFPITLNAIAEINEVLHYRLRTKSKLKKIIGLTKDLPCR